MSIIKNVVKSNGKLLSWEEFDEVFTVKYLNGKPTSVTSTAGKWADQWCNFLYSATGEFLGMDHEIETNFLPYLIALANGMVTALPNLTGMLEIFAGTDAVITCGTNAPNDADGKPDGSIYFQI